MKLLSFVCVGFALLLLLVFGGSDASSSKDYTHYGSVFYDPNSGKYDYLPTYDDTAVAYGAYQDTVYSNGWGTLIVNSEHDDFVKQAYASGYLEGSIMHERIYQMAQNILVYNFKGMVAPQVIQDFMNNQHNWLEQQIQENPDDEYWKQVSFMDNQIFGLVDGYNSMAPPDKQLSWMQLYLVNSAGDLEDLIPALIPEMDSPYIYGDKPSDEELLFTDCSGLIRVLDYQSDVYVGHTTWRSYSAMLRTFKFYNFAVGSSSKFANITFSSSPGFISSKDDMYTTSHGLVTLETTNSIFNKTLYALVKPESVLVWMRTMAANRMASNGVEWTTTFKKFNSGTYNNQWMVINMNLVEIGKNVSELPENFLRICEQIPGEIADLDVTDVIKAQQYWPSYNIPYIEEIYNKSGYAWPSTYETCPRANIFRRNATSIETMPHMQSMMQYNDWQTDPFSLGEANNAVSSRYDLRTPDPAAFGGIDSKVTSLLYAPLYTFAISGPTHDQQEPFEWTEQWKDVIHEGQPDNFDFEWVQMPPPELIFWK